MMLYLLFFIAVVFNVFFNTSIPSSLGYGNVQTLAFMPMLVYFFMKVVAKKIRLNNDVVYIILLGIIIFIFKWAVGQNFLHKVTLFLIFPMIITMCFDILTGKELALLRRITIIFFVAECGLSIVEWTLNHNFFVEHGDEMEYWLSLGFFRSTSLMGHPLANAQIVAVFMTFIALSNFKKKNIQLILFFLGYIALFCVNARGATIVVTVFTAPYFIWKINKTIPQNKKWVVKLGVFCMFCGMLYMVTQTSLGGRLMNMDIMDESAQTRIGVFKFYDYYQTNDEFLWGHTNLYGYMMKKLGAGGVENGVVVMILEYGIIFTIPILLLLFRFQYRKLSVYPKFEKWLLLAVFYLIGSMNANLVFPVQWILWLYAYYVFRPGLLKS